LKHATDWKDALNFFGSNRTSNKKGVTIPSQKRYVMYYEQWLKAGMGKRIDLKQTITITGFTLKGKAPDFDVGGGCDPFCIVETLNDDNELTKIYDAKKQHVKIGHWKEEEEWKISDVKISVTGNVKIVFKDADMLKDDTMFAFFVHTGFIKPPSLTFTKADLDKACKNKEFPEDFRIIMYFEMGGTASPNRKAPKVPGKK